MRGMAAQFTSKMRGGVTRSLHQNPQMWHTCWHHVLRDRGSAASFHSMWKIRAVRSSEKGHKDPISNEGGQGNHGAGIPDLAPGPYNFDQAKTVEMV